MFFGDFPVQSIALRDGVIRYRMGGSGPPLLMLHGNPQTHAMWHKVAPILSARFTVVCPDLRGYGQSHKPPATADHAPYAKREMARELVELMGRLGFERFQVVGHDRGARSAHRMAIDHPERVQGLALLDIVPTLEHFERADMAFGLGYYHWFWFAQPHPFPETLINAAPEPWFFAHTSREPKGPDFFAPEALADYLAAARDPEMIRGMCEDYRAAATIDLDHDRASRAAGEKIRCPLLVIWGEKGKIGQWYDPVAIWTAYTEGPITTAVAPSGHYIAEEAPGLLLGVLHGFLDVPD